MSGVRVRAGVLFDWAVERFPDRVAAVHRDRRITFHELSDSVHRLANGLRGLGLAAQDRVAVLMANSIEALVVMQAVHRAGLVFVRLNPLESNAEKRFILSDSEASLLILDERFLDDWLSFEASADVSWPKVAVPGAGARGVHSYRELIEASSPTPADALVAPDDMVNIAYTSGTTGRPKGVVNTHRGSLNRIRNDFLNLDLPLGPDDVLLTVAPLTHAAGLIAQLYSLRGACNVILDGFDVAAVLAAIEAERVTAVLMVPTMIVRLLQHPTIDTFDLSSLRRIYYGTAPMPVEPLRRAIEIFGNVFRQQYGLTEHPQPVLYLHPDEHVVDGDERQTRRLASMGRPVLGVEVKVVGDDGERLPPDQPGEIWVRSDAGMAGYWRDPEATAEAITPDGWLKTGDVATVDEDGYHYMVDRKKEMIISGGFNVYPREVEEALESHPEVREAAVFGVPDDDWGEAVRAAVVLGDDAAASEQELIDHCRALVARYKVPKSIELRRELPRNTAGKILRRVLREPHWQGRGRKV